MQLVAGVAGALLLGPFGLGLVTAGTGFAVGAYAYGVFGPRPSGAGPGDLSAPKLQLGAQVQRVYGRVRVPVSPIWISDFRATEHESGGKGAPSGPSYYTYDLDVLGLLCDGTNVQTISRIWINKKLVWTALADSDVESIAASGLTDYFASVQVFTGGASQVPWGVYEDAVGATDAPAYRGMCTIGIRGLQCGGGKQPPMVEVELVTSGTSAGAEAQLQTMNAGAYYAMGTVDSLNAVAGTWDSGAGYLNRSFNSLRLADGSVANVPLEGLTGDFIGSLSGSSDEAVLVARWGNGASYSYVVATAGGAAYSMAQVNDKGGEGARFAKRGTTVWIGGSAAGDQKLDKFVAGTYIGSTASLGTYVDTIAATSTSVYAGAPGAIYEFDANSFASNGSFAGPEVGGNLTLIVHNDILHAVTSTKVWRRTGGTWETVMTGLSVANAGASQISLTKRSHYFDGASLYTLKALSTSSSSPSAWEVWRAVGTVAPQTVTLKSIIDAELALIQGFDTADADTTDLAAVEVIGYVAAGPAAATIEELCDVFYVDVIPGSPIRFKRKGVASVATIAHTETGMGSGAPGRLFDGLEQSGDDEISGVKAIAYPDIKRDHNPGFQRADRLTTEGPDIQRIGTRVVMTPDMAKGRAITAALIDRLRRQTARFALSDKFAGAEPGDSYTVSDAEGNSYRLRIDRLRYADGSKECDWQLDDANALVASGITDMTDQPGIEVAASGIALWEAMDLPQLRDLDEGAGYYLAAKTSDASRAYALESSNDVTYTEVQRFGLDATFGSVVSISGTLAAGNFFDDVSTITVDVGNGALASATRDAMLADRTINAFAICSASGACRVVGQFRAAGVVSAGIYTISGLLIDRWESARNVAAVAAGDVFCLLTATGGMARIARSISQLGVAHFVKVVAERRLPASIAGEAFTAAGVSLKPMAPVQLRRNTDASTGDSTYTFQRCTRAETRFGSALGDSCPIGELAEQYRVRFFTDGTFNTVVRDLGVISSASFAYGGAQRTTDYGSSTATAYIQVNQLSSTVGEGYPLRAAA